MSLKPENDDKPPTLQLCSDDHLLSITQHTVLTTKTVEVCAAAVLGS